MMARTALSIMACVYGSLALISTSGGAARVLSSFKRMEDWEDGATDLRGAGGPVKVTRQKDLTPASQAFIEALAATAGTKRIDDYNGESRPFENKHGLFTATADVILRW